MNRYKKIRGLKRRQKHIGQWVEQNMRLDVDLLKTNQNHYCKIRIDPWDRLDITGSKIPLPPSKIRKLIIEELVRIYHSWKSQLDALYEPYYLKIWLFEPDFMQSQVVVSVGKKLHFYDNTFPDALPEKNIQQSMLYQHMQLLDKFSWNIHWDMFYIDDLDLAEMEKQPTFGQQAKKIREKIKRPTTLVTSLRAANGYTGNIYNIPAGTVWVGEVKV